MIAIDTTLLVYAHREATPEHLAARAAIERAAADPRGWGVPYPCVAEFWSIATHPASTGRPSTGAEAHEFLASLIRDGRALIWYPREGAANRLTREAIRLALAGVRIFDLQIALIAADNGATEIWTHDAAFVAPAQLTIHDPLT